MGVHLVYRTADVIAPRHSAAVQRVTRHRHAIMGRISILAAGAALTFVPAMALAQEAAPTQPPPPGSLQGFQLDPSRDTGKPKVPEREGPEIDNRPAPLAAQTPVPVVVVPPPVTRTVTPTPAPSATPSRSTSQQAPQQHPAPVQRERAEPATQQPAPAPVQPVVKVTAPSSPASEPSPQATQNSATGTVAPQAVPAEIPSGSNLPWIIIALVAAGIAGLVFRLRRKRPAKRVAVAEEAFVPEARSPVGDMPRPAPTATQPAEPAHPDRPNAAISIEFQPLGARHTLIGAAIGYRIVLHNEGEVAAENVAIASMIVNADARQEQGLASFFAEPVHAATHSAERIEPGFSVEFAGELRLASDAIVPIQVKDRALLIPLVAFSAHYRWEGGNGYSAAAFIVGEESDPPRERMAPFRLDQGPRQYRSVGSRAARKALVG
jgi:hypothetical protein